MNIKGMTVEQVRQHIGELPPDDQAHLMLELERGVLRGEDMPNMQMVMEELRQAIRKSGLRPQRVGNPSRWFFRPLEPFIIDGPPEYKQRGYVARASLTPIWLWICRDLLPAEAKAYSDRAARALLANNLIESQKLARAFQDRAIPLVQKALSDHRGQQSAHQRIAAYTAPSRAIGDLQHVVGVLAARDALAALALQLPIKVDDLDGEQLDQVMELLDPFVDGEADIFLYALIATIGRLESRWQLIRLGIKAAQDNAVTAVEKTHYGLAATLVLGELDDMMAARQARMASGDDAEARNLGMRINEAVQAVRTELNFSDDPRWARRFVAI